jgi:hypothetical protein
VCNSKLEEVQTAGGACRWDPIAFQRASVDMRQGSPAAGLVRVPQWLGPVGLRVANQGPGIRWLAWPKHEPRRCKTARLGACAPQSRNGPHLWVLDDAARPWHGGASQAQSMSSHRKSKELGSDSSTSSTSSTPTATILTMNQPHMSPEDELNQGLCEAIVTLLGTSTWLSKKWETAHRQRNCIPLLRSN